MATTEGVARALGEYREMLKVDGADLELVSVKGGVVQLRLLFGPETCQDCVLSRDMLETVLLAGLEPEEITQVVVVDPREAA
jgi:Fe-S cluster biogenesis protein NfuA